MTSDKQWMNDGMAQPVNPTSCQRMMHHEEYIEVYAGESRGYYAALKEAGYEDDVIHAIKKNGTPVMNQKIETEVMKLGQKKVHRVY